MDFLEDAREWVGAWIEGLRENWSYVRSLDPSEIRPLVCVRAALSVVTLGSVVQVQARTNYINSNASFEANDRVVWDSMGRNGTVLFNPSVWKTKSGLRFRISKPAPGSMRLTNESLANGRVLCLNTTNSTSIHIDFDEPVSGAAAEVAVSQATAANLTVKAYDRQGALLLESVEAIAPTTNALAKYMGAVSESPDIKSLDFTSDTGTIELGRMDLRSGVEVSRRPVAPKGDVPTVSDQIFFQQKNSPLLGNTTVAPGASNVTRFVLLKAPSHAASFQLYADGVFDYRPEANFSGSDSFLYAGIGSDGYTYSLPGTASINVAWNNSAPTFRGGPDQKISEEAGLRIIPGWATQVNAGAPDENKAQRLAWIVNTDQPMLFLEQPSINAEGTLRYAPAPHASGVAHVTVWLKDDGGTVNGGADTSTPYHFTIEVASVTHKPILTDLPEQTLHEGETLNLRAIASSVDLGKVVVYSLENAPQGMAINPLTGTLNWAPSNDQIPGTYDVTIRAAVSGEEQYSDRRSLRINALRFASGPVLKPIASRLVHLGEQVRLQVTAQATQAPVQYLLGSTDASANLDAKTGEFTWKPTQADAGKNHTFLISAFDPKTGSSSNVSVFTVAVESPTFSSTLAQASPTALTTSTKVQTMRIVGFSDPAPAKRSRSSRHSKKYTPKTHKPVRARTAAHKHRRQARRHVR